MEDSLLYRYKRAKTQLKETYYTLPVCLTNMSYQYALRVFFASMPYQYVLPVCITSMPHQYALTRGAPDSAFYYPAGYRICWDS